MTYKNGILKEESYFNNDYKNPTATATNFNKGVKSKISRTRYYDKKGNIIRIETRVDGKTSSSSISYDKFGALVKVETETSKMENVHTYDDKNNLVKP